MSFLVNQCVHTRSSDKYPTYCLSRRGGCLPLAHPIDLIQGQWWWSLILLENKELFDSEFLASHCPIHQPTCFCINIYCLTFSFQGRTFCFYLSLPFLPVLWTLSLSPCPGLLARCILFSCTAISFSSLGYYHYHFLYPCKTPSLWPEIHLQLLLHLSASLSSN